MEDKRCEMVSLAVKVSIKTIGFFAKSFSFLSSLAYNPLFSIIIVLYSLILLYFPRIFFNFVFSPVLIFTGALLITLLRLRSIKRVEKWINKSTEPDEIDSPDEDHEWVRCEIDIETRFQTDFNPKPLFSDSFLEWNVGAPLEIIYEDYEGEEEDDSNEEETAQVGMDRLLSSLLYYPQCDTDSSSDGDFPVKKGWNSPESMSFRWDEEDREGLIEIRLDDKRSSVLQVAQENLIEIEIPPFGAPATN